MMISPLDRYIFKRCLWAFLITLTVLSTIVTSIQSLRFLEGVLQGSFHFSDLLTMSSFIIPSFIQLIAPFALFLGVLHQLYSFYTKQELVAFSALGLSPLRVVRPLFWLGGVPICFVDMVSLSWSRKLYP